MKVAREMQIEYVSQQIAIFFAARQVIRTQVPVGRGAK